MNEPFLKKTRDGIAKFCEDTQNEQLARREGGLLYDQDAKEMAWLWFKLRVAEDKPEWFPSGKWATLQHMSDFLEQEAKR